MYLQRLSLHNFRLYEEEVFEFDAGLNVISGLNAQGKTTLLEAIYYLMTGRSFRTQQTKDLIRQGAEFFSIEGWFLKHGIQQRIKIAATENERKIIYNQTYCHSSSNLLGLLQGVMMAPDDNSIIKGVPLIRRSFLDLQIAQTDPLYVHYLTRYNKAMRQRNCLLKAKNGATIESWEQEMANAAAYLTQQRSRTIEELQMIGKTLYSSLNDVREDLEIQYKTDASPLGDLASLKHHYMNQWKKTRRREMEMGFTTSGPHKDDFILKLNQREARSFASEGQQRSCVAALRLAEWKRIKEQSIEYPLMLVDDFGISLDDGRREKLLQYFSGQKQVFLTTTNEQFFNRSDRSQKVISIKANQPHR